MSWVRCAKCGLRAEEATTAEHPKCPGRADEACGGEWTRLGEVLQARAEAAVCDGECAVKTGRFCADCVQRTTEAPALPRVLRCVSCFQTWNIEVPTSEEDGRIAPGYRCGSCNGLLQIERPAPAATPQQDFVGADAITRLEAACAARPEPAAGADLVKVLEGVVIECLDPTGAPLPDAIEALKIARRERDSRAAADALDETWREVSSQARRVGPIDTAQYLGLGNDRRLPRAADARTTVDQPPPEDVLAELRIQAETSEAYRRSDADAIAQALGMQGRPAGLGDVEWQACIEERAEALVHLRDTAAAFLDAFGGESSGAHFAALRRALSET